MSVTRFKVLTFDVVGTLIDFERGMLDYVHDVAPGARITDEDFLRAYRIARKDANATWYPDDLVRCWRAVAPALGLPDDDAIARGFRDSVARWPAFADSVDALKRLRKHFKLVTMTNAQQWALEHFCATLDHPFDLELSCDDALCEKPDPRYFAYARGRFEGAWGYRQEDNLHVAQSQYHDIGVSMRLGIATCWIERRHAQRGSGGTIESEITRPDYHFRSLAELADAVDAGR
ncbi:HAD-IA family hydrolase [Burkholderia oklahomensis]|uniref:HAD hydrolase, IA, variant 1 family protein n=1 Tax=Burkholderia oklahomensis TaxID=342113 RepID=A0AAI8BC89_9BURK|nr:HAD-IA family hydrolase [Burkholderia oklahomensis]AIO69475.1 HAD hydrolase, IA, variant 1 family protein [Burkholderia oklahomensis]AJX35292.1 HAD hydrolase, IA, variant 1 family protein [Burkholderia oklahomensis C6786]AOI39059.1 2-haloalkanoic acid dehalogenase [Burkholderia oklahomensis EO147]AOI48746.1 2-haloalkanoic acid dehalogenase [Burkholderia oklahomensis C6786]KUY58647.1 2-haloalkanoic acid dehalogenase [Burkholderia oklahomensis C6786]